MTNTEKMLRNEAKELVKTIFEVLGTMVLTIFMGIFLTILKTTDPEFLFCIRALNVGGYMLIILGSAGFQQAWIKIIAEHKNRVHSICENAESNPIKVM